MTKDDLIANTLGKKCIVRSHQNKFLFQGKITAYDSPRQQVELVWDQSTPPPTGSIRLDVELKMIINDLRASSQLIVVEGCVAGIKKYSLMVDAENVFSKQEDRDSFRQPVKKSAVLCLPGAGDSMCTVQDISAGGVGLITQEDYEIGTRIGIKDLQLRSGRPAHSVFCIIKRRLEVPGRGFFYGCQFCELTTEQEDMLYCDLFALQADELHRKRDQ